MKEKSKVVRHFPVINYEFQKQKEVVRHLQTLVARVELETGQRLKDLYTGSGH